MTTAVRLRTLALIACCGGFVPGVAVAEEQGPSAASRTYVIPAPGGSFSVDDLTGPLADVAEVDGDALRSLLPTKTIRLDSRSSRLLLIGCDLALDGVDFNVQRADDGASQLVVTVDSDRLRRQFRSGKSLLRDQVQARTGGNSSDRFGLKLDLGWKSAPADQPLIVLVHGYTVTERNLQTLAAHLKQQGHVCGLFVYPNDGPIAESAERLAQELSTVRESDPRRRVAIVGHSMGGLVARAVIEDPRLDPGNVSQLIMIATPNHGSELARLPVSLDAWEHLLPRGEQGLDGWLTTGIDDGLNEARGDLKPDSAFLRELNARPRNPNVRYSLLLGNGGPFDEAEMQSLCRSWDRCCERSRTVALLGPRVEPMLNGNELRSGQGDGAVSLESGRLEGVADVVVLPFRHNVLAGGLDSDEGRQLLAELDRRLGSPPAN